MNPESVTVVFRGGGDLGSGVAHRLHRCGMKILILEKSYPLVVRRTVSFAQAVMDGSTELEGVKAVCVDSLAAVRDCWKKGTVPVMVDPEMKVLEQIRADVLVDATLAKRDTGIRKGMAPMTIALGPGFTAGVHADVVIETNRGHDLGRLIFEGEAEPDTGVPAPVKGFGRERVLRAPCGGSVQHVLDIGDIARKDEIVCKVDGQPVKAAFDGVIRGLIMEACEVSEGMKIGDIDPRPVREHCFTISDKARALGGAVLEAIFYLDRLKEKRC